MRYSPTYGKLDLLFAKQGGVVESTCIFREQYCAQNMYNVCSQRDSMTGGGERFGLVKMLVWPSIFE